MEQCGRDAGDLAQQRPQPHRSRRDLEAQQLLDGRREGDLGDSRAEPVMAVREHECLAIVAGLEQLLSAAVQ
jgi:hypothetical protein